VRPVRKVPSGSPALLVLMEPMAWTDRTVHRGLLAHKVRSVSLAQQVRREQPDHKALSA
jgi:hypothetical protein